MSNTNETNYIDDANWDLLADGTAADAADVKQPLLDLDGVLHDVATGATAITPDIDGGSINNTPIGNGTPKPGTFSVGNISVAQSAQANFYWKSDGLKRWNVFANPIASGGNLYFGRYRDDSGNNEYLGSALTLSRATGNVYIANDLQVVGTKQFLIDHPLDPANKVLRHVAIESADAKLLYSGQVVLDAGQAMVDIDMTAGMAEGTFAVLTRHPQIFITNNDNWDRVRGSLTGGVLTIESQNAESTAMVDWLVIAERDDIAIRESDVTDADGRFIPEADKAALEPDFEGLRAQVINFLNENNINASEKRPATQRYVKQILRGYQGGRLSGDFDVPQTLVDRLMETL